VSYPFGRWVFIDRLPDEPVIAFVYLDRHAGPSAKGGLASDHNLATMPTRTVRLSTTMSIRPLAADDVALRRLPARPDWVVGYGPQPDPDSPWHHDPLLVGKFHPEFPDDVQTYVHDGDPRRTRVGPELCWVRLLKVERAPTRRLASTDVEPSRHVYLGDLLSTPHSLKTVKRGDRVKVISVHGLAHPLHVTDDYLREREEWTIAPCDRCGATEVFDPPSVMVKLRFPDAPPGSIIERFTTFCSLCGGMQELSRVDG
jgi:hypothetical protein